VSQKTIRNRPQAQFFIKNSQKDGKKQKILNRKAVNKLHFSIESITYLPVLPVLFTA